MKNVFNENELMEFLSKMSQTELRECFGDANLKSPWEVISKFNKRGIEFLITIYRDKTENGKIPLESLYGFDFSVYCSNEFEAIDLLYQLDRAGYTWESGELLYPYRDKHSAGRYFISADNNILYYGAKGACNRSDFYFDQLVVKPSVTPDEVNHYLNITSKMNEAELRECFGELGSGVHVLDPHVLKRCIENWNDKKAFQIGDVVRIIDREKLHIANDTPDEGFICYISDHSGDFMICFMDNHYPEKILYEDRQYVENTGRKVKMVTES